MKNKTSVAFDEEREKLFVRKFIQPEHRSRILYELLSPKKRSDALQRLFADCDEKYSVMAGDFSKETLLREISKRFDVKSKCYVISDSVADGKETDFLPAFDYTLNYGGVSVLLCGNDLVFIKDEYISGKPDIEILYRP